MQKKRLGKTGLKVSEVGFGGIPITRVDLSEGADIIRHCFDLGVNFFDTARFYGDSESKVGAALEPVRDKVVVATKTMARDAEEANKQLEESLNALKTNYIDLYQAHNISTREDLEQVMGPGGAYETFRVAKENGRVNHIGVTSHNQDIALEACRTGLFETLQFPFNFVEHDPAERLFKAALEIDMGIIAMKPLGGGHLDRADLCFGFLQGYGQVVPIAGIQSKEEIEEIISLYRSPRPLSDKDWKEIEKIRKELGDNFCHRCGYCMPCKEGILIPRVLLFKSQMKRFPRDMVMGLAEGPMKTAEGCVECGECEEKCPYGLKIPELIREYRGLFVDFVKQEPAPAETG